MELTVEQENQTQATAPAVEPPKSIDVAKQELGAALRKFKDRVSEAESNAQRLITAQKEHQDLLEASMDEETQVDRLSKIASLQRLLESKVDQWNQLVGSASSELRHATEECVRSFRAVKSELQDARRAAHLAVLKEIAHEKWDMAEIWAQSFISRFAGDLIAIQYLGDQAVQTLRGADIQRAAEELIADIVTLESEAAKR